MKKKILIILGIILLFNMVTIYAGTALYGYYLGYDKVKILIDGKEVDTEIPGFIIENTTVLPLRVVAKSLDTIVVWNDELKTANIMKPNVNMQFTANPVFDKDKNTYMIYGPFGKISANKRYHFSFHVYTEVDNLPKEVVNIKVVLKDPDGEVVEEGNVQTYDATEENSLQYINFFEEIDFTKTGNYSVEFMIKSESTKDKYLKIGKKLILVK